MRDTSESVHRYIQAGQLYAVLDSCDQPAVPVMAWEVGEERAVSLYRGTAEEKLWDIAPYLFRIDDDLLQWVQRELWPEPWGIFAVSAAPFAMVRQHFRRFLLAEDADGERMYFRFYDPRVLPAFLSSCLDEELTAFFGPLSILGNKTGTDNEVQLHSLIEVGPRTAGA